MSFELNRSAMRAAGSLSVALLMWGLSLPATAANQTGVVQLVEQDSPAYAGTAETFAFTLAGQATLPCGAYFLISPNTVADAQTRKNLVTVVLMAKATGASLKVAYDSNATCVQGQTPVSYLQLQ